MQNLEGKKTALDDNAEIYKTYADRADSMSAREHWKALDRKGKWQYFLSYYLWKVLAVLAVLLLLGYMLYSSLKPKPDELAFVVILDLTIDPAVVEEQFENYVKTAGYDPKKAVVTSDKRLTSSGNNPNDVTTISTYIFAGTLDILVANNLTVNRYASQGALRDLAETLPEDILKGIPEEKKYYFHYVPDKDEILGSTEKDILVGLRMDGTNLIESAKYSDQETGYVLSLVTTGKQNRLPGIYKILRAIFELPQAD